jgi:glucose-1-phosphate cytidylyltransferase
MRNLSAIVLCGGKGERLRPFTDSVPKTLVPLKERPLLHHLLRSLYQAGIRHFVLCVGHKAEAIEKFIRDSTPTAWRIDCVNSGDASMSDRILHALEYVSGPVLICYGDTIANINIGALQTEHKASKALATLTVYPLHSQFGIVEVGNDGRVIDIVEKPVLPHWINIGYMICEPEAFQCLCPETDLPTFAATLAKAGKLHAYQHHGKHATVNTEKERREAEEEMLEFFTVLES